MFEGRIYVLVKVMDNFFNNILHICWTKVIKIGILYSIMGGKWDCEL